MTRFPLRGTPAGPLGALALMAAVAFAPPVFAQAVPEAALAAEMQQDWSTAAAVYRDELEADPDRTDLWKRLADVLASDGQPVAAAQALDQAVETEPNDAELRLAASAAWAQADRPEQALEHCRAAAKLRPDDVSVLRTCAQQANWVGDSLLVVAMRERIHHITGDPGDLKAYARALGQAGELDESVALYEDYLAAHPDDAEALLDYATIQTWRGAYADAAKALGQYRDLRGEDAEWAARSARLLAWAHRPTQARPLNDELLDADLDNYEHLYTRMLILRGEKRNSEAIAALEPLKRLRPESKDTLDAIRSTHAPLRSNVGIEAGWRDDADDISLRRFAVKGRWSLTPETYLYGQLEHRDLRTKSDSPYIGVEGDTSIDIEQGWVGARHRVSPLLEIGGEVGAASIDGGGGDHGLYGLYADLRPLDNLWVDLSATRRVWDISPKSASLGILMRDHRARIHWQPTLRHFVNAELAHGRLSDGNRRNEVYVNPYRAMLRSEHLNLDLGVSAHWQDYDKDLANGYYDPENYRRFAFTAVGYWKFSDDDGLSVSVSPGWHTDESLSDYKFGTDVSVELINGIYRNWYSRLSASYSDRSQTTGRYDAYAINWELVRRF
ncbi:tetratricopeptide repeat protein [Guyparkeria hydrothermalis]|uniref:tetratricopeptide repeat protein n=1 Tax=Guyparkeria hydrothermalis TaxID=923 RepID=UPI002020FA2E|nr:tetratricopeptide repeat protein [Guyparkeria hydrothermalis]MCL7744609.1 tetratricopeptide repeat protein [Guyparkeria hydrothermalis]